MINKPVFATLPYYEHILSVCVYVYLHVLERNTATIKLKYKRLEVERGPIVYPSRQFFRLSSASYSVMLIIIQNTT